MSFFQNSQLKSAVTGIYLFEIYLDLFKNPCVFRNKSYHLSLSSVGADDNVVMNITECADDNVSMIITEDATKS